MYTDSGVCKYVGLHAWVSGIWLDLLRVEWWPKPIEAVRGPKP